MTTTDAGKARPADELTANIHDPTHGSFPLGREGQVLFWIAVAFSLYQIGSAAHVVNLPSQVVRAFHVGFLMLLAFPLVAAMTGRSVPVRAIAWALGIAGMGVALYQWWEYVPLIQRSGFPLTRDIAMGVLALVLVFVAAWIVTVPATALLSAAVFHGLVWSGLTLP